MRLVKDQSPLLKTLTSSPLSWMGSSPLFKTALTEAQNIWSSSLTSPFLRLKPSSLARALVALRFDFVGRKLDSIQRCPPVLNCLASIRPFITGLIMGNAKRNNAHLHKFPYLSEAFGFFSKICRSRQWPQWPGNMKSMRDILTFPISEC